VFRDGPGKCRSDEFERIVPTGAALAYLRMKQPSFEIDRLNESRSFGA
jgi:hypothetical protein